jgi:hypothetical protein
MKLQAMTEYDPLSLSSTVEFEDLIHRKKKLEDARKNFEIVNKS